MYIRDSLIKLKEEGDIIIKPLKSIGLLDALKTYTPMS